MAPIPNGKVSKHVKQSNGADTDIMKFYITEYSSNHGIDGFIPQVGSHPGTGYKSNFRPGVYYSSNLDKIDNPEMGDLISDNYVSTTQKSYQPWKGSSGTDPLPEKPVIRPSGFTNVQKTLPSSAEISFNTPKSGRGQGTKQNTGNVHNGNNDYVSENHAQYTQKYQHVNTHGKTIGRKEESGFTREMHRKLTEHQSAEGGDDRTGISVMKASYVPSQCANDGKKMQGVSAKGERDGGYTRSVQLTAARSSDKNCAYTRLGDLHPTIQKNVKKKDPTEFMNLTHTEPFTSVSQCVYEGKQPNQSILVDKMRNVTIGKKENTGYTSNTLSYTHSPDEIDRFSSAYKDHYSNQNLCYKTNDKMHIDSPQTSGYTKNERVNCIDLGKEENRGEELQKLHPYVARSLKARDPFYAEQNHTYKMTKSS